MPRRPTAPTQSLVALALLVVYIVWGGTFLAVRFAVAEVPPLALIAMRCGLGALVLLGWLVATGQWSRPSAEELRVASVAGTFMFLGCHGVLAWEEQHVPSGQAALAFVSLPMWLVLLVAWRDRRRPSARVTAGLALGAVGVAVLAGGKSVGDTRPVDWIILVLSALSWAVGSLWASARAPAGAAVRTTALQLAAGALVVGLASVALREPAHWDASRVSARALGSLAFLVLGGTALGLSVYTWLLTVTTPALAGSYAFVNPAVALALAWTTGDEPFRAQTLFGAAFVLGAVALVREPQRDSPPNAAARTSPPRPSHVGAST